MLYGHLKALLLTHKLEQAEKMVVFVQKKSMCIILLQTESMRVLVKNQQLTVTQVEIKFCDCFICNVFSNSFLITPGCFSSPSESSRFKSIYTSNRVSLIQEHTEH